MTKKTSSVFLSHSSKDAEFVGRLAAELKTHGIEFWLDDHELDIGDPLYHTIGEAIEKADYFAVVLSQNSIDSNWVQNELNLALNREFSEGRTVILPIMIEDVTKPHFIKHKNTPTLLQTISSMTPSNGS